MSKLISIGEALIDFVPNKIGCDLKDVDGFVKSPGGAPANVAACVAKLGGESMFVSKLGEDAFGDCLVETIQQANVNVDNILRTNKANTGLAFVSLKENGERDFSFYRKPSADMLLCEDEINIEWFLQNDILHFCSVDLIEAPVKYAHSKAIQYAIEKKCIISFDPNVRLPLWDNPEKCRETILEFIPYAHIVKISDDELEFITGIKDEDKSLESLFVGNIKMIVYTKGKDGVEVITKSSKIYKDGCCVKAVDTTGAGDSFIGSFLFQLLCSNITVEEIDKIAETDMINMLRFSNACAGLVVSKKGVINVLPTRQEVEEFIV